MTNFLNLFLSSAKSMESNEVPNIFILFLVKLAANFKGVWPPNWTIQPKSVPLLASALQISITDSSSRGSKYKRSDVSKSVETVSGLQLIMIDSIPNSFSAYAAWTQQ